MNINIYLKIFIIFIMITISAATTYAQIASPQINIMFNNINPAVVAYDYASRKVSVGGTLGEGDSAESISGRNKETRDISYTAVVGNLNIDKIGAELYSLIGREEKITDKQKGSASYSTNQESNAYQLNLGYKLLSWFSLGVGANKEEKKILDDKNETSQYGAGVNFYFANIVHFGLSSFSTNNKGTYIAENDWMQSMLGVALAQRENDLAWRMEVSYSTSPESITVGDSSGLANNYHPKTTEITLGCECFISGNILSKLFMGSIGGLLFGISKSEETKNGLTANSATGSSSTGTDETTDTWGGHAMLLIMNRQLEIGPSFKQKKTTQGENQATEDLISISVGFKM